MKTLICVLLIVVLIVPAAVAIDPSDWEEIKQMQRADTAAIIVVLTAIGAWLVYLFTREPKTLDCVIVGDQSCRIL